MNLLRIDLNLLKIFESIYRLRNLTDVANEVSLTQPAISHALNRLRESLDDRLFVRTARGLEPTSRADEMALKVKQALEMIEDCLYGATDFRPQHCTREFRLLLSDVGELIFVAKLVAHLREHAPRARITVMQAPRTRYHEMLGNREADVAIGHLPELNDSLEHRRLFKDRWVILRAKRGDAPPEALSMDQFRNGKHVAIDPPGSVIDPINELFAKAGMERQVVLRLPHFFALPTVIRSSDLVATMPHSLTLNLRAAEQFDVLELPFTSPVLDVGMYWHLRQDGDVAHRWLRDVFSLLFSPAPA